MQHSILPGLSMGEMARLVASGAISPVELAQAHLDRIADLQPKLNAFTKVHPDYVLEQARRAEVAVASAEMLGPLHGAPVSIKSSIAVAGLPLESGSRLMQGNIAQQDAVLVHRMRRAGAVILGTTNLPEMLMAYESDNLLYGRVNHHLDPSRTPGGSSGGEAAAIASGMSAGGVGSDSGGSVRVPAHYSGICALKPTPGRIPGTGHDPACVGPFSLLGVVGPMARSVGDLRVMLDVTGGYDEGDPASAPVPISSNSSAERLRIGYMEEHPSSPVTAETRAAVRSAAACLSQQGHEVFPSQLGDLDWDEVRRIWWTFFVKGGEALLKGMYAGRERDMAPILRDFMLIAESDHKALTGDRLLLDWVRRDQLRAEMMRAMEEIPILITPVCSVPAFRHGEREWLVEGKRVKYLDAMSYTQWFNVLGNPCVVVPAGTSPEGLPIGIQIVAKPWCESLALDIAQQIESTSSR
ncbi:MAG: amidase [Acidobacteriaceae bacterium]